MIENVTLLFGIFGLVLIAIPAISLYGETQRFKEEDRAFEAQKKGKKK